MTLKISIDASEYTRQLKRLDRKLFPTAVRNTLNQMALKGALSQRGEIKKVFTTRNRYVTGSIIPNVGKRYGFIPTSNNNIHGMNAFTGTRQQYMADQERGFSRANPSIPTYLGGRMGGVWQGKVRGVAKMKAIKRLGAKRVRDLGLNGSSGETRTKQAIAMLSRQGYRGFLKLGINDGWNEGYYKMTATKIKFVRSTEFKNKRYKARPWHRPAINRVTKKSVIDFIWGREARVLMGKL
jgi:hypothetical protein